MSVIQYIRKSISNPKNLNQGLFICNVGLGDHIDMIGAVRYLSQFHDQIHIPCFRKNFETLSEFYSDNKKVVLTVIDEISFKNMWFRLSYIGFEGQFEALDYEPTSYTKVYRAGWFKYPRTNQYPDHNIPKCFYIDLGLDLSIEHSYFHVPENLQSKQLYETVKNVKYIFVQQQSSSHFTPLISWDINEILTIDPNINLYSEGHQWYQLASHFVNKPFPHYTDTIIHASELHIVNSSFRCLSAHLPLEATIKKCYNRETGEHIPEWTFNRHNPTLPLQ
jgi:hypothetical protein